MHYLLYEPSEYDYSSEKFVLLKTDANEELVQKFIKEYFFQFQILLTTNEVAGFDEGVIDVKTFTEDEMNAWFHYKQVKEETELKQNNVRWDYLRPWQRKVDEAIAQSKKLDEEERVTIFTYIEPEEVTRELIAEMKEQGYEKHKTKNGKVRFRHIDHEQIRQAFELRRQAIKQAIEAHQKARSQAAKHYDETHEIVTFEPVKNYTRLGY